ncbi:hypothetical protein ACFS5L_01125 [Streptomyces phyllanthi]|uniref:Secreted protein n=1 Tax=Streptomyces phyllanthi TaxID=1803180 RepID=A0A5N8W8X8_9ACTN|nr:hypothetical protein [Streptomyces phyllanthi]MPY43937.1 hypothetical protein [Streptomyces phyllanthi]
MRDKRRSLLGALGALVLALVAVFAAGPAQAAQTQDRDLNGISGVFTLPAAPEGVSARSAAAVSPGISPAAREVRYLNSNDTLYCTSGNLCNAVWDPTRSQWKVFFLYNCATYTVYNWLGTGAYYNNQTGNPTSYYYGQNWGTLWTSTPDGGARHIVNFDPVYYIKNC